MSRGNGKRGGKRGKGAKSGLTGSYKTCICEIVYIFSYSLHHQKNAIIVVKNCLKAICGAISERSMKMRKDFPVRFVKNHSPQRIIC